MAIEFLNWYIATEGAERVSERLACPNPACGEDRQDWLAVADFDSDMVHCETCGVWYRLPEPDDRER